MVTNWRVYLVLLARVVILVFLKGASRIYQNIFYNIQIIKNTLQYDTHKLYINVESQANCCRSVDLLFISVYNIMYILKE